MQQLDYTGENLKTETRMTLPIANGIQYDATIKPLRFEKMFPNLRIEFCTRLLLTLLAVGCVTAQTIGVFICTAMIPAEPAGESRLSNRLIHGIHTIPSFRGLFRRKPRVTIMKSLTEHFTLWKNEAEGIASIHTAVGHSCIIFHPSQ